MATLCSKNQSTLGAEEVKLEKKLCKVHCESFLLKTDCTYNVSFFSDCLEELFISLSLRWSILSKVHLTLIELCHLILTQSLAFCP